MHDPFKWKPLNAPQVLLFISWSHAEWQGFHLLSTHVATEACTRHIYGLKSPAHLLLSSRSWYFPSSSLQPFSRKCQCCCRNRSLKASWKASKWKSLHPPNSVRLISLSCCSFQVNCFGYASAGQYFCYLSDALASINFQHSWSIMSPWTCHMMYAICGGKDPLQHYFLPSTGLLSLVLLLQICPLHSTEYHTSMKHSLFDVLILYWWCTFKRLVPLYQVTILYRLFISQDVSLPTMHLEWCHMSTPPYLHVSNVIPIPWAILILLLKW